LFWWSGGRNRTRVSFRSLGTICWPSRIIHASIPLQSSASGWVRLELTCSRQTVRRR
jgi:hypothetical protein